MNFLNRIFPLGFKLIIIMDELQTLNCFSLAFCVGSFDHSHVFNVDFMMNRSDTMSRFLPPE
jgi:hypothetical protein